MIESDEIIDALELTGKLMELHGENPFKTKALTNAAFRLSKLRYDFNGKSKEDLSGIEGIGSGIVTKILDLMQTGTTPELQDLMNRTPAGVIQMMGIKGLGPKKVAQLWRELQIESVGELLYACNENRLVTLKGFGEKTQHQVKLNIEFKISNERKFHYADVETSVNLLCQEITKKISEIHITAVGQLARKCEVIDNIEILVSLNSEEDLPPIETKTQLPVHFHFCSKAEFVFRSVELSATPEHLSKAGFSKLKQHHFDNEIDLYKQLGMQWIAPELREGLHEVELALQNKIPELIKMNDLKGILHNHTTASDGVHTLKEMSDYCKELGYEYLGICDHSVSAFYANGLSVERVINQQKEIDALNKTYKGFKVLKGIESDILNDGSLDYPEEILKTFDFVVASVHSNLKMNEEKATSRLIAAIENPYTSILGHPTGRLLLARPGYPIDHKKVIDACAANKVHIELNAHPYRLDIDWRWIPYCLEKGVMISINPDAHHREGLKDMYYGVCAARKGMLSNEQCLNALSLDELMLSFKK